MTAPANPLDTDTTTSQTTPEMRSVTIQVPDSVAQKMAETYDGTLEDAALAGLRLIHGMGTPSYTTLQSLAKQLGTSVPKTLRTAIAELQAHADRLAAPPRVGRPRINEERDASLFGRVSRGATYAEVADAFGLSIVRVGQIMAQQRAMRGIRGRKAGTPQAKPAPTPAPEVLSLKVPAPDTPTQPETPAQPAQPDTPAEPPRYVLPGLKTRNDEPSDGLTAIERDVVDPEFGF